jgi:hypothetical protein
LAAPGTKRARVAIAVPRVSLFMICSFLCCAVPRQLVRLGGI